MEKPILKKTKTTLQITYPAPYSQTWNTDQSPVLVKNTLGRNVRTAKFFNCPKRSEPRAWSQSYAAVRGPDPTAPHLKYGVFPNRRASSFSGRRADVMGKPMKCPRAWSQSYDTVRGPDPTLPHLKYGMFPKQAPSYRALPRNITLKPIPIPHAHGLHPWQNPQDLPNNKNNIKKKPTKKAVAEAPMFIFRTIDNKYTRQLSLSEIMHVDIKPKKRCPMSPSFCPSPTFKILTPKLSPIRICRSPI